MGKFPAKSYGLFLAALSLIKTDGIDELAGWIKKQRFAWQAAISTASLQYFDRPGSYRERISMAKFFDLGNVIQVESSSSVYPEFEKYLDETVIWKAHTPYLFEGDNGVRIDTHSGLTVYLQRGESVSLDRQYENTTWYKFLHSSL